MCNKHNLYKKMEYYIIIYVSNTLTLKNDRTWCPGNITQWNVIEYKLVLITVKKPSYFDFATMYNSEYIY